MCCNFGGIFPIYQPRIINVLQFWCFFPYLLVSNSRIVNRVKFSTEISIYAQYYRHSFILGFFNYLLMASMVTSIHLVKPLDFLSNNVFSKVVSMYKNRVNIARSIFIIICYISYFQFTALTTEVILISVFLPSNFYFSNFYFYFSIFQILFFYIPFLRASSTSFE